MLATVSVATAALASLTDAHGSPAELLRLAGTMLLQAVPFMLILFVLFPRVQGPLWGLPRDAFSGLTGLSRHDVARRDQQPLQSDAIAFRVQFDGRRAAEERSSTGAARCCPTSTAAPGGRASPPWRPRTALRTDIASPAYATR